MGPFGISICLYGSLWVPMGLYESLLGSMSPYGSLWGLYGVAMRSLWVPMGSLWVPMRSLWGICVSLWVSMESLWVPMGPYGAGLCEERCYWTGGESRGRGYRRGALLLVAGRRYSGRGRGSDYGGGAMRGALLLVWRRGYVRGSANGAGL